jgi:transcriptional regulator with XRE-family HTH domain
MQALSPVSAIGAYHGDMPQGRPSTRKRTDFGQRLFALREATGLTQAQVAQQLGISQRAYSDWERDPVALQPERLAALAAILGTTAAHLLGEDAPQRNASSASAGRLRHSYQTLSKLPRRQQTKILDVVDALLAKQGAD